MIITRVIEYPATLEKDRLYLKALAGGKLEIKLTGTNDTSLVATLKEGAGTETTPAEGFSEADAMMLIGC